MKQGIAVLPYYGLAAGFLSGKYDRAEQWQGSARASSLDDAAANGGWDTLDILRAIATEMGARPAQVALAWLNAQAGLAAPLASATSREQVSELVGATALNLSPAHLALLNGRKT